MPVPKPTAGEDEKTYHGRCMGDPAMQEYEQDQRNAICYRTYSDKDKKLTEAEENAVIWEVLAEVEKKKKETLSEVKDGLLRIAIAYTGRYSRDGKPFQITLDDLKSMQRNLQKREVPMDYEHLSANPDAPPGHSRASGWIKAPDTIEDFHGGRKILWGWSELTPSSLMAIKQGEYRYFSPEIHWRDKDESGKDIGTRLAAGAITNRPFLKDLPPISVEAKDFPALLEAVALSEHRRRLNEELIDVGDVHVPGVINNPDRKDKTSMRLKKLGSGKDKGKYGVFDGEEQVGVISATDVEELAEVEELRRETEDLRKELKSKKSEDDEELRKLRADSEELRTLKARKSEDDEELKALKAKKAEDDEELKALRTLSAKAKAGDLYIKHNPDGDADDKELTKLTESLGFAIPALKPSEIPTPARKAEVACLREFAKTEPGEKTMELAESMLEDGKLSSSGYLKSQKIEKLIDGAIQKGKLLPKQRQPLYELAILDFETVKAFLSEAKPVIDLRTVGFESARSEGMSASEELTAQVKQRMTEKKIDYAQALTEVTRENPTLWQRHTQETAIMVDEKGR